MSYFEEAEWIQIVGKLGCCGCGAPQITLKAVHQMLKSIADKETPFKEKKAYPDGWDITENAYVQFMAYTLDNLEFTEHGTSIRFPWLTEKGKQLLNALNTYEIYDYEYDKIPDEIKWTEIKGK